MNRLPNPLGAALGISLLLAACNEHPTEQSSTETASLSYTPPAYQSIPHAFVGQVVNLLLLSDLGVKCLDIAGGIANVGDYVQVYPCHNGLNQQWKVEAAPLSAGSLETHNLRILRTRSDLVMFRSMKNPSLCLDVRGATANGGETVQVFNCQGERNQAFLLPRPNSASPSPTTGPIKTEVSGFGMVLDGGNASQPWVTQRPWNQTNWQHWGYQPAGTGFRL